MTIERCTFPDGSWIDMRDAVDVPERLRRPIVACVTALSLFGDELSVDSIVAQTDLMRRVWLHQAAAIVAAWSWSSPISASSIEELPGPAYDLVLDATATRRDAIRRSWTAADGPVSDPKASAGDSPSSAPTLPPPT